MSDFFAKVDIIKCEVLHPLKKPSLNNLDWFAFSHPLVALLDVPINYM